MKKVFVKIILIASVIVSALSCGNNNSITVGTIKLRPLKDTVGFAQYSWQMDSLMSRIIRGGWQKNPGPALKLAVCPHDDYTYVGALYPELLQNIKAPNLILIGVAHRAASMGIEDSLVFDSFTHWKGPWGNIAVSPAREEIYSLLKNKCAIINDTLQKAEHSVEAMIPYLQYFNRKISIVSILVPAMNPERMEECGKDLAAAIREVARTHKWEWGTDYAVVVTTDAVHYGNEDWGGVDRAYFGCDDTGNSKARDREHEIIKSCFEGAISASKIKLFNDFTIKSDNFREYKWTWCGRYCVPVALYTALYLNESSELTGKLFGYSTSITSKHISVDDLIMGTTAIATNCHWVGYAAIGYQ